MSLLAAVVTQLAQEPSLVAAFSTRYTADSQQMRGNDEAELYDREDSGEFDEAVMMQTRAHSGVSTNQVMSWAEFLQPEVVITATLLFVFGIVCAAAGVGGGGVFVVLLMLFGKLDPHDAVPLSKAIVFTGACATTVLNLRRWVKLGDCLIDLEMCRVVVPASMIGTFAGVCLNWHADNSTVLLVLTGMLMIMTCCTFWTSYQQYQEECRPKVPPEVMPFTSEPMSSSLASTFAAEPKFAPQDASDPLSAGSLEPVRAHCPHELRAAQAAEEKVAEDKIQVSDGASVAGLLATVAFCGTFRYHMLECGHEKDKSIYEKTNACSNSLLAFFFGDHLEGWLSNPGTKLLLHSIVLSLPILVWTFINVFITSSVWETNSAWTAKRVVKYQLLAIATGIIAGLVGVGGGLILAPAFLLAGMDPSIAVGTSSTCVLFTSASTTLQYSFTNRVIWSLAIAYGSVTVLSSLCGTWLVQNIREWFPYRKSYISFIVTFTVALSVAMVLLKFIALMEGDEDMTY